MFRVYPCVVRTNEILCLEKGGARAVQAVLSKIVERIFLAPVTVRDTHYQPPRLHIADTDSHTQILLPLLLLLTKQLSVVKQPL